MIEIVIVSLSLFVLFFELIRTNNMLKTILTLNMMVANIVLIFIIFAKRSKEVAPIGNDISIMVDPLPQALMITTIIIGAAITALAVTITIKIFHNFGSFYWDEIKSEDGSDD